MTGPTTWQQVEFGSYGADLPTWVELASEADGPILELGAGAGRVSLHLAGHGHQVTALERDPELVAELKRTAARENVPMEVICGDLADPIAVRLQAPPALAIGPLHLVQLIEANERASFLAWLRGCLAPGGRAALTVVDEPNLLEAGASASQILPDMRELDGAVYSSQPLWVLVSDETFCVRRVRERVSPEGAMDRVIHDEVIHRLTPEQLEQEGADAGFSVGERRQVDSGPREADSVVVVLEVPK